MINCDGYSSAVIGYRAGMTRLRSLSAHALYSQGGLYARVIDKPAETAAKGCYVDDEVITDALDALKASQHINNCLRWALLDGGAAIIPIVADGGTLQDEVNYNNIQSVEGLRVYSVNDFAVHGNKYNDPSKTNYGEAQFYEVDGFIVHESRVITIPGEPLPGRNHSKLSWHGRSIADAAFRAILEYKKGLENAQNIMQRKQQAIYAMAGLYEQIEAGKEDNIQKRINLVDQSRSIINTVAVDDDDTYTISDSSLSGVEKVIEELQVALSAETGIPVSVLFGRSDGGLNSTGEHEMRNWYDLVQSLQETKIKPAMGRLVSLIAAQKSIRVTESWQIEFEPLFKPTAKEQAEINEKEAQALNVEVAAITTAIENGTLSEQEATQHMAEKGMFGLSLDDDGVDYAKETA